MEGVSGELSAHETSSYDTEEYYRGYDDEEESIQSSLTPGLDSANSYTSDKWQVYHWLWYMMSTTVLGSQ